MSKQNPITWMFLLLVLSIFCLYGGQLLAEQKSESQKIRVLIITGGHDFEREPFFNLFKSLETISFQEAQHPEAYDFFRPEKANQYDVIVLYDMGQDISEEAKKNFINLLKKGKGLVALHHSLASYQNWEEYSKILGGKFYLQGHRVKGVEKPPSSFKHGVRFTVHIADPNHPVTRGLKDFEILDETYGNFEVNPKVKVLLTTDEPSSGRIIGWANTYGKARIVYLQLGHDHTAYENPHYRRLILQAIRWVAGRRTQVR